MYKNQTVESVGKRVSQGVTHVVKKGREGGVYLTVWTIANLDE